MKLPRSGGFILAGVLAVISGCSNDSSNAPPRTVAAAEIENGTISVVGALGLPLGTVSEVEAVVMEQVAPEKGAALGTSYVLRVEQLAGRRLAHPPTLRFRVAALTRVVLARNEPELRELLAKLVKSGAPLAILPGTVETTEDPPMSPTEAEALRASYVGSRHRLVVFETAGYVGTPAALPDDAALLFGGPPFGFVTHLVVLAAR
jgi:hypothetical protein